MEKHEVKAITMVTEINRLLCRTCTTDKVGIEIAIWQCKEYRNTLYRHNLIHGQTSINFESLEQVIFWDKVKEYLKTLLCK
jgi:hypothetical protein